MPKPHHEVIEAAIRRFGDEFGGGPDMSDAGDLVALVHVIDEELTARDRRLVELLERRMRALEQRAAREATV